MLSDYSVKRHPCKVPHRPTFGPGTANAIDNPLDGTFVSYRLRGMLSADVEGKVPERLHECHVDSVEAGCINIYRIGLHGAALRESESLGPVGRSEYPEVPALEDPQGLGS